jgi:hypothetical protein
MVMIVVFNEHMNEIFVGTWVLILLIHLISGKKNPMLLNFLSQPNPNAMMAIKLNDKHEITSLRIHPVTVSKSICMTLTCIAIMAVDFPPLFARYLCKTEEEGWGLMDVGVSSLMISAAWSSKLCTTYPLSKKSYFFTDLKNAITGNIGVCLAASVRFFLLTGVEYHDHVTEWGVHWNFFLTIAILNIFNVFLRSTKYAFIYGIALLLL